MMYGTYPTADPIADFNRWERERQKELDRLPRCGYCDNPIQEDVYFEINGECVCEECLNEHHRKWVDDYVE